MALSVKTVPRDPPHSPAPKQVPESEGATKVGTEPCDPLSPPHKSTDNDFSVTLVMHNRIHELQVFSREHLSSVEDKIKTIVGTGADLHFPSSPCPTHPVSQLAADPNALLSSVMGPVKSECKDVSVAAPSSSSSSSSSSSFGMKPTRFPLSPFVTVKLGPHSILTSYTLTVLFEDARASQKSPSLGLGLERSRPLLNDALRSLEAKDDKHPISHTTLALIHVRVMMHEPLMSVISWILEQLKLEVNETTLGCIAVFGSPLGESELWVSTEYDRKETQLTDWAVTMDRFYEPRRSPSGTLRLCLPLSLVLDSTWARIQAQSSSYSLKTPLAHTCLSRTHDPTATRDSLSPWSNTSYPSSISLPHQAACVKVGEEAVNGLPPGLEIGSGHSHADAYSCLCPYVPTRILHVPISGPTMTIRDVQKQVLQQLVPAVCETISWCGLGCTKIYPNIGQFLVWDAKEQCLTECYNPTLSELAIFPGSKIYVRTF